MTDNYGRTIDYLRLSITDQCNLNCHYCKPHLITAANKARRILPYKDLLKIVQAATDIGIKKIRLTGGEPLVREGVIGFIRQLNNIQNIEEISLTTNGLLLCSYAQLLKGAGIKRINVSIDSLYPEVFRNITQLGSLKTVFKGINLAELIGLKIKLNVVVMKGVNDDEILSFAKLSKHNSWSVRFIEYMPTNSTSDWNDYFVSGKHILNTINNSFNITPLESAKYSGPAKLYQIEGAKGSIGIITPMSNHFCNECNRVRVTSTGLIKNCLLGEHSTDLRPHLNRSPDELSAILKLAINNKPRQHPLSLAQTSSLSSPLQMASIGG